LVYALNQLATLNFAGSQSPSTTFSQELK